jgi:hypothetical protein
LVVFAEDIRAHVPIGPLAIVGLTAHGAVSRTVMSSA